MATFMTNILENSTSRMRMPARTWDRQIAAWLLHHRSDDSFLEGILAIRIPGIGRSATVAVS